LDTLAKLEKRERERERERGREGEGEREREPFSDNSDFELLNYIITAR